jgi:MFS family permease
MIGGAALITVVHLIFTLPFITQWYIAVILMILLGIGFAMVPAAMWPALAKIIPQRQFGTAMALTFYIQNIGLWGMPLLIGHILDKYCVYPAYKAIVNPILAQHLTEKQTVDAITSATVGVPHYDYTLPMLVFVITCGVSVFVAFSIKWLDKRKGYGLQEANIKK